jgi:hypothetical protein
MRDSSACSGSDGAADESISQQAPAVMSMSQTTFLPTEVPTNSGEYRQIRVTVNRVLPQQVLRSHRYGWGTFTDTCQRQLYLRINQSAKTSESAEESIKQ